jgi:hypothetical protein
MKVDNLLQSVTLSHEPKNKTTKKCRNDCYLKRKLDSFEEIVQQVLQNQKIQTEIFDFVKNSELKGILYSSLERSESYYRF